jgi:Tol biopolymer transport system component
MLWVLPTNGVTWRQVGGTEGANSPFWSPDSQSVAYFAGGELKVVRVSGGLPRVLCKTCATNATSGTWSRDDVILFGNASALIKVSSRDGHTAPAITLQKDETAHLWPSFLPDGQRFLYLAQRPGVNELRVGSLTSAETVSLGRFESSAIHADGYLLFVRNGILMAQLFDTAALRLEGEARALADRTAVVAPFQRGLFAASAGVLAYSQVGRIPSQLTWMDRDGKALATVGDPGTYGNLDLSPDGRQLAVSQLTQQPEGPNVDIWLVDLDRAGTASRLTSDPAREFDPAWSTDGTEIAFNSDRYKGKFSLFRRRLGDGEDELLVRTQTAITAPDWSPSDRSLIYSEIHEETRGDLWILPPSGERKPRAFLRERFEEGNATFSPNGQWIAYHSDESGRREVHVRAYPGPGARYPISRDGGRAARWRGDGKELFFLAPDGTLMAAEIKASKDFQAGVPRQLFKTSLISTSTNNPYAVSSDGKRFLVQVPLDSTGSAPITVVLNWSSKLRGN